MNFIFFFVLFETYHSNSLNVNTELLMSGLISVFIFFSSSR